MGLYVDCAVVDDVARVCADYPVTGVTTNPTILLNAAEQGQRLRDVEVARALLPLCPGPVFMQPVGETAEDLVAVGMRYMAVDAARVVLKLPMSGAGVRASRTLKTQGVRFAFTAVASLAQAYSGALAGAEWIIPYFGRMRRAGIDACERVGEMSRLVEALGGGCRILAASVKTCGDVIEATLAGAHDVTVPPEVIRRMTEDALSQAAVAQFTADWGRLQELLGNEG